MEDRVQTWECHWRIRTCWHFTVQQHSYLKFSTSLFWTLQSMLLHFKWSTISTRHENATRKWETIHRPLMNYTLNSRMWYHNCDCLLSDTVPLQATTWLTLLWKQLVSRVHVCILQPTTFQSVIRSNLEAILESFSSQRKHFLAKTLQDAMDYM